MRVIALEIPDDPRELPGWLEQRLTGFDLAPLVAELEAVHGSVAVAAREEPDDLDALLDGRLGAVLEHGLSELSRGTLRRLLLRPRRLLELQEHVLLSGGEHWRRLLDASEDLRPPFERGRHHLAALAGPSNPVTRRAPWSRRRWVLSLAAAASILLGALLLYVQNRKPAEDASRWGWSRPGALPEDAPAPVYLNRLADAALDWFRERPEEPAALTRRIGEFRQGCDVLILAAHTPLAPVDRDWLVNKCRAWAAKLDAHQKALQRGAPVLEVRGAADQTVRQLIEALRQRARAV